MRSIPLICIANALLLSLLPLRAQAASFEESRDQGTLYFKKGHFKLAKLKLDGAYRTPQGKQDFRTLYYRGRSAQKLLLLETAFEMAKAAGKLPELSKKMKSKLLEFQGELDDFYGPVYIKPAKGETNSKGRIFLESKTGIINRQKKRVFLSIRERFRALEVSLPLRIYLPYGDYLANNIPFTIARGEKEPVVNAFLQIIVVPKESKLWWYVGIGGATAVAAGLGAFLLLNQDDAKVEDRLIPRLPQEER